MRSIGAIAIVGVLAGAVVGPPGAVVDGTAAQPSTAPADHVWTTDDLERLYGRAATPATVDPAEIDAEQKRIEAFLERQYARIDADRDYDLARSLSLRQAAVQVDVPRSAAYIAGRYFGFLGPGFGRRPADLRHEDRMRGRLPLGGNVRPGSVAGPANRFTNRSSLPANIPKLTFDNPLAQSGAARCDAVVPRRARR